MSYGYWISRTPPLFFSITDSGGPLPTGFDVTFPSRFNNRSLHMMCRARVGWREAGKPIPKSCQLGNQGSNGDSRLRVARGWGRLNLEFWVAARKNRPVRKACFFREPPSCRFRKPAEHFQWYVKACFFSSVSRAGGNIQFPNFENSPEKIGQYVAIFCMGTLAHSLGRSPVRMNTMSW